MEVKNFLCEVEHCYEDPLPYMCQRPTQIFEAVKKPLFTQCLLDGEHEAKDDMINGKFRASLKDCILTCHHRQSCKGFSYDQHQETCTMKTDFDRSKVHPVPGVVSGAEELCQPWMTMFKHDSQDSVCPLMFTSDVLSYQADQDPQNVPLYSNLNQLNWMKNQEDELTLRLTYPRSEDRRQLTWKQTSNPLTEEQVGGFELLSGHSEFAGLQKSNDLEISAMTSPNQWYSIGYKSRNFDQGLFRGFPGYPNATEDQTTSGEVTLVELEVQRQTGSMTRTFHLSASSANEKTYSLLDGIARCFPDDELYFRSDIEDLPYVRIDFQEARVVKGVVIYLRSDALAPSIQGSSFHSHSSRNFQ